MEARAPNHERRFLRRYVATSLRPPAEAPERLRCDPRSTTDPSAAADTKSPTGMYKSGTSGTWSGMRCRSCHSQARVAAKRRHGTTSHMGYIHTPSTPTRSHDTTWHSRSPPLYDAPHREAPEARRTAAKPSPLLFKTRIPPNPTPTAPQKTNKARNPPVGNPPRQDLHPENNSHGLAAKRILHGSAALPLAGWRLVSRAQSSRF